MKSTSPAAGTIIRAWPSDPSSVSSRKRTGLAAGRRPLVDAGRQAKRPGSLGPRTATRSECPNQRLRFFAHPSGGVRDGPLCRWPANGARCSQRSDLTLHGGPRLATEYRRTVRLAGRSRISARTVCKSAARAFSAIGRPAVAPQRSPPARHSSYRARRGNPRRSSSRVCQPTAGWAPRRTPTAQRPRAPTLKTEGFSPRWALQSQETPGGSFLQRAHPSQVAAFPLASISSVRPGDPRHNHPSLCGRFPAISPHADPRGFRRAAATSPVLPWGPPEALLDSTPLPASKHQILSNTLHRWQGIRNSSRQSFRKDPWARLPAAVRTFSPTLPRFHSRLADDFSDRQ